MHIHSGMLLSDLDAVLQQNKCTIFHIVILFELMLTADSYMETWQIEGRGAILNECGDCIGN